VGGFGLVEFIAEPRKKIEREGKKREEGRGEIFHRKIMKVIQY
jgi:hypothetical protein